MKQLGVIRERLCAWVTPRRKPLSFILIWAAIVWRYLSCGIAYCWQHDDYIQYINYPRALDYVDLLKTQGLLSSRPLAAICDLYVWQHFSDMMIVAVLLLALLYAGSAMLWQDIFRRRFGTGTIFTVVYTLLPLGFEGTYWFSAGTRLICGLFFGALANWLLMRYAEDRKIWAAVLYFPVLLISCGHYEQTLVLSMAVSLLLMLDYLAERNRRSLRSLMALLTFPATACYFAVTMAFADAGGALAERVELLLPTTRYYFSTFLPQLLNQLKHGLIKAGLATTFRGFVRGCAVIFTDGKWLWLLVCLGLCALYGLFARREDDEEQVRVPVPAKSTVARRAIWGYVFGLLLTLAPLSIFFIIANPYWFSVRNTLPAFVGLAFLTDLTVRLCLRRFVRARAIVCAALALFFCIGTVSEMDDCRKTYEHDLVFLDRVIEKLEAETDQLPSGKLGILGANATYLDEQNYLFNGHITGISSSAWELEGALTACTERYFAQSLVPLPTNEEYFWLDWNRDERELSSFATLWFWDEETQSLRDLSFTQLEDGSYRIVFAEDGSFCATVWEKRGESGEQLGYLRFTE